MNHLIFFQVRDLILTKKWTFKKDNWFTFRNTEFELDKFKTSNVTDNCFQSLQMWKVKRSNMYVSLSKEWNEFDISC